MFFRKKTPETKPNNTNAPPPWMNIDTVPQRDHHTEGARINIFAYVQHVTGFGKWGTRFLLLGFALSILFVAYAYYYTVHTPHALPRDADRPALDKYASSSIRI